jgi:hypothetical protein
MNKTSQFVLIHEKKATPKYRLLEKMNTLFSSWQYEQCLENHLFLVHEGDALIDGHLRLDFEAGWITDNAQWREALNVTGNPELNAGYGVRGLIVIGNLTVNGSIINASSDRGAFLYVSGNVCAGNLVAGGGFMQIDGNACVRGVVYGHYNDGQLSIRGDLACPVLINTDHDVHFRELQSNRVHFDWNKDSWEEGDNGSPVMPDALRKELAPAIRQWDDILLLLSEGKNVLHPSAID